MTNTIKDIVAIGATWSTSIFSQIAPDNVGGWEKAGVITILVFAISYLLFEKRSAMKELQTTIDKQAETISDLRKDVGSLRTGAEELRKSTELALDRCWECKSQKPNVEQ